ncbi:hypothetical protein PHRODO_33 [Bacillus phage Phrodo]|uniref:Uncharacterized protein n=1 Tax=Bacillus phage Juglone TaxID=1805949 RepID=A0A143FHT3_9CAUD|nr:hypothetical protein BI003_gp033 [Bacillus phage Phrodo]AMW61519.1 hypothetical protein JUGLONE_32 [Bacillus phage Juglone]AMW62081.1 hypothetical protein PHRODO_33 [Bacillus phage Phrodo]QDH49721.1 hypothetical protein BEYONPHE_34 [Bacillus phage Beyonphe]
MMGLNPLKDWYKPSGYMKWYYYPIGLILIGTVLGIAWVLITIADFISRLFSRK